MENTNGTYIVVDLHIDVPEDMLEQYGLREIHLPESLFVHAVGPMVNLVPDNAFVTAETSYKNLSYRDTLVRFSDKYWLFDYDSLLGVCVAAIIASSLTCGTMVIGKDKSYEITFAIETLKSFKGASILDTLFGILNATLSTKFYDVRTLCWYIDKNPLVAFLLKENNGEENHGALSHVETTTGGRNKAFYNYVEGCESLVSVLDEISESEPAFPLKGCCFTGVKIDIKATLAKIEASEQVDIDTPEPKGVRLSDFDTPNFMSQDTRDGIRRTARTVESMRDRLKSRDSRDRRLAQYEELENDVYSIVRDLKRVFDGVNRILLDMDNNVPASAALAVTTIVEEGVKEIQRLVSGARKDTLIGMLENEISMGRGNSSFNLKDELLELLDDHDRRDRRRVRSGYRGWAEVDCKRRDCDCEHCQYERRSPRDDRDEDDDRRSRRDEDDRRDRRPSRHRRTR